MSNSFTYILFILVFICAFSVQGQVDIKGRIIDSENGVGLGDVIINDKKGNYVATSAQRGNFELSKSGIFVFSKLGYFDKVVDLKSENYVVIQLEINPWQLNETIVNANLLPKTLKESAASIAVISKREINRGNTINIAPVLNRVPGVFMQSGALNTNRITIRGIGSRNLYGTAKIRAYFKDIPLTTGNGETNIEDFELGSISSLEIIKGASSVYGAGLGGTIQINPQNTFLNQSNISSQLTVGSYGLLKGLVNVNQGSETNSFRALYSNTHSDGYRENNEYKRQTFTVNIRHIIDNKNNLSVLLSYVDLKAFIPSSIDYDTYLNSPKSAAFTWKASKGFEDSKRGILGVSWSHQYSDKLEQITSIFTSFKDVFEPRPFNILDENTMALGLRTRLLGNTSILDKDFKWTVGVEGFGDQHKSKTFENLYTSFPPGHGSEKGDVLSDFKQNRSYFNLFFESNYQAFKRTTVSVGMNYNQTQYQLDDNYPESENNPDQSGHFKFKGIFSPKIGVSHKLSSFVNLYANASHGFSPVTLEETLLPDGQINTSLKPETGWNFEIGTKGSILNNRLVFNASIFRLSIKNLLVSRRISDDQFVGINAGKTAHDGLEFSFNYKWIDQENMVLNQFVSYTVNNFVFKDFVDGNNDYSGNDLTGVPNQIFNTGVDYYHTKGVFGNVNFQYVGRIPITDSNSLYSDAYKLVNLKVGYKKTFFEKLNFSIFFGLNNIFNEKYASQILINASSFGGRSPRYYYPGNPSNFFSGINLNYSFK